MHLAGLLYIMNKSFHEHCITQQDGSYQIFRYLLPD